MLGSVKDVLLKLFILFAFYDCVSSLIIPEELPTILSLIYSNIPPIKKGTDSRVGVGFRLGQHADFQVLLELGPQSETQPIGNSESKRRRAATMTAAMKGELGPLAQMVAKYQIERKLQQELEKLRALENAREKENSVKNDDNKVSQSDWLNQWRKDMTEDSGQSTSLSTKTIEQRIGRPPKFKATEKDKFSELTKLYKLQDGQSSEQHT